MKSKQRTTVRVPKSIRRGAEKVRDNHGFSFSDLVRMALAEKPSLDSLLSHLPSPSDATVALNEHQWEQVEGIREQARRNGHITGPISQADVLRALVDYQLKKLLGGASPGG
jgi:hypothetical protein